MSEFRDIESRTFRAARDDGLWDVMLASVVAMFALAPLLSHPLGDFWSSAVFVPVWLGIYVGIRLVREHVIRPRIGTIEIGAERRRTLSRASVLLLGINIVALIGGSVAWLGLKVNWLDLDEFAYPISLGLVALLGGLVAASVTRIWRFAAYGLMLAIGPTLGELLWQKGYVSHHGFPLVFGTMAVAILLVGIGRSVSLIRHHPVPTNPGIV